MDGILGRKLGMTQIYAEDGTAIPVTVIKAGPCLVVQRKTEDDGRLRGGPGRPGRGEAGEGQPAARRPLQEGRRGAGAARSRSSASPTARTRSRATRCKASIFAEEECVDVVGTSKGKGFQGVMKRHGFAGGRATHGSMFHRAPGSIGSSAYPSRVFPGMRGTGRMGGERVTVKNLQIVKIDAEQNLIYVRGAVPGPKTGYLAIRRAKRG